MRSDDIVTTVREACRIGDSDDDWTDARIRALATTIVKQIFGQKITDARCGSWLHQQFVPVESNKWRYRFPYRSMGVESVELSDSQLPYELMADTAVFGVQPNVGAFVIFTYYTRPSLLVQEQDAGEITDVDIDALTVTVNTIPVDRNNSDTAIATADYLDIVHPNGSYELSLVGGQATISGTVLTFAEGTDLQDVAVGDFVRAAEQTDWPVIEDSYHQCLCDLAAARILRTKGNESKAKALEAQALLDVERFADVLEPRVKDTPETCVPTLGPIRGGRRSRFWGVNGGL